MHVFRHHQLDRAALREAFLRDGYVEVPNFAWPVAAHRLRRYLQQLGAWEVAISPNAHGEEVSFAELSANAEAIARASEVAEERGRRGEIAYRFRRAPPHREICACIACDFTRLFRADGTIAWLDEVTGLGLDRPGEVFTSCYRAGDYLSPHHDGGNGALAFVYHVSSEWPAERGGLLHLLGEDWRTVVRVLPPRFNTLQLFRVVPAGCAPHFVSRVEPPDDAMSRLALSGWYRNPDTRDPWTWGRLARAALGNGRARALKRILRR